MVALLFYCIGKIDFSFGISVPFNDFSVYNKVEFPWTVHICEATFLILQIYYKNIIFMLQIYKKAKKYAIIK